MKAIYSRFRMIATLALWLLALQVLATLVLLILATVAQAQGPLGTFGDSPFDANSLSNPYGAGSPYRSDGLMNPYSRYGSRYSNYSWKNPYATRAPKLYNNGRYMGRWSANRFDGDSTSNPFGRYGSPYSSRSLNNPYVNRYRTYVYPGD